MHSGGLKPYSLELDSSMNNNIFKNYANGNVYYIKTTSHIKDECILFCIMIYLINIIVYFINMIVYHFNSNIPTLLI